MCRHAEASTTRYYSFVFRLRAGFWLASRRASLLRYIGSRAERRVVPACLNIFLTEPRCGNAPRIHEIRSSAFAAALTVARLSLPSVHRICQPTLRSINYHYTLRPCAQHSTETTEPPRARRRRGRERYTRVTKIKLQQP